MSNTDWVISDTHFGHLKLTTGEFCSTPRLVGFEQVIIDKINLMLSSSDTLYHLGDVAFASAKETKAWLEKIKPEIRVVIVRGNHDNLKQHQLRSNISVSDMLLINKFGKKILLTHEPVYTDTPWFDVNVHGHIHENNAKY